jgi:hypothetical protein
MDWRFDNIEDLWDTVFYIVELDLKFKGYLYDGDVYTLCCQVKRSLASIVPAISIGFLFA